MSTSRLFEPGRAAGLLRLRAFLPSAGRAYADRRNSDYGPDRRDNVSVLSPYLRHRLVTEAEVLEAVLDRHSPASAEKFIQEVLWRAYFKGHLETRPEIWRRYRAALAGQVAALDGKGGFRKAYEAAISGRTGIDAFDAWVSELEETGYLHNHARMWFASIWIFTLRLPWELGADFMIRHLLDGDPASNTSSWRWVGGLHTRGKTYLARPDNIAGFTGGRFSPRGLAKEAIALDEPPLPAARPPRAPLSGPGTGKTGLLLTEEDLHPESLGLEGMNLMAVAGAHAVDGRSPLPVAEAVQAFTEAALTDGLDRAARYWGVEAGQLPSLTAIALGDWARRQGLSRIVTAYAPLGPVAEALAEAAPVLAREGITLVELRRAYDEACWPHATRGFFALKEKIPSIFETLGLGAGASAQGELFSAAGGPSGGLAHAAGAPVRPAEERPPWRGG
ncbi:FAD-binding domain-containing protein [Rhabdaerophilum sp. SD176]|uniref:FAD-binding domain-containing protein n=1 Tax=Rhabdaerophilum sp. SD176 TaxID=2983548 RepID=UPI0024E00B78|nr:FAD-binding domain-containing protein [Rhabdaerophilum sp. SD176]